MPISNYLAPPSNPGHSRQGIVFGRVWAVCLLARLHESCYSCGVMKLTETVVELCLEICGQIGPKSKN